MKIEFNISEVFPQVGCQGCDNASEYPIPSIGEMLKDEIIYQVKHQVFKAIRDQVDKQVSEAVIECIKRQVKAFIELQLSVIMSEHKINVCKSEKTFKEIIIKELESEISNRRFNNDEPEDSQEKECNSDN